jgi:hypothetical protein
MREISVEATGPDTFQVSVVDGGRATSHEVTVDPADVERLADGADAARLVEASFRFLLDREPSGAIMRRFDLTVISRYFPEYPDRIGDYLAGDGS